MKILTGRQSRIPMIAPATAGRQEPFTVLLFSDEPDRQFVTSSNLLALQGLILSDVLFSFLASRPRECEWAQSDDVVGVLCPKKEFSGSLSRAPLHQLTPIQLAELLIHSMTDWLSCTAWMHPRNYAIEAKTGQIHTMSPRLSCLSPMALEPTVYNTLKDALFCKKITPDCVLGTLKRVEKLDAAEYLELIAPAGDLSGDYQRLLTRKSSLREHLCGYGMPQYCPSDDNGRDYSIALIDVNQNQGSESNLDSMPMLKKNIDPILVEAADMWHHYHTLDDDAKLRLMQHPGAPVHAGICQNAIRQLIDTGRLEKGKNGGVVVYHGVTEPYSLAWRQYQSEMPVEALHTWTTSKEQALHEATVHGNYGIVLQAELPIECILHSTHFSKDHIQAGDGHKLVTVHTTETVPVHIVCARAENHPEERPFLEEFRL